MDERKTKIVQDKFIYFLIIATSLIDLINGVFQYILEKDISPGVMIRTFILLLIFGLYIKENKFNSVKFIGITTLFLFQQIYIA